MDVTAFSFFFTAHVLSITKRCTRCIILLSFPSVKYAAYVIHIEQIRKGTPVVKNKKVVIMVESFCNTVQISWQRFHSCSLMKQSLTKIVFAWSIEFHASL